MSGSMPQCIYFVGTALFATMTSSASGLRMNAKNWTTAGEGCAFVTRKESRVSV